MYKKIYKKCKKCVRVVEENSLESKKDTNTYFPGCCGIDIRKNADFMNRLKRCELLLVLALVFQYEADVLHL